MSLYLRQFGRLKDWVTYAQTNLDTDAPQEQRESYYAHKEWSGVGTREEAFNLFLMGEPEGAKRMKDILASIHNHIILPTLVSNFYAAVEGQSPNIEAFLQGQPEDMFHLIEEEKDAPPSQLNVQLELCVACLVQPVQMFWAGATVWCAVEALKAQGCNVSLLLTHTVSTGPHGSGDIWQSSVPVPNNLDLDSLSFLLTHPSVLRIIIVAMMEHETPDIRNLFRFYHDGSYAYPTTHPSPFADVMLPINKLAQSFSTNEETNLTLAIKTVNKLVDTKFQKYV